MNKITGSTGVAARSGGYACVVPALSWPTCADLGLVAVRNRLDDPLDQVAELGGHGVADGIGDVDHRRPGVDGPLDDLAKEVEIASRGIHRGVLDVINHVLRHLDAIHGHLGDLGAVLSELVVDVNVRRADEDVNPWLQLPSLLL